MNTEVCVTGQWFDPLNQASDPALLSPPASPLSLATTPFLLGTLGSKLFLSVPPQCTAEELGAALTHMPGCRCQPLPLLLALCYPPFSLLAGMLGFEFYKCARSAQQKNLERRSRSFSHVFMPDGRQLKFYRGARKNIPERVLEKIR